MRTMNIRRTFIVAGIMALFVSYLGIWIRFINDPIERTGSDFIAFYSAGKVAQQEGMQRTYDPILQQAVQQEEVGFQLVPGQVLLYNHLPFLVPLLQLIVGTDYVSSFYRWVFLLIALYIAGILILSRVLQLTGIDRSSTRLTALGSFLFLPVFFSLMNGQDTAFVFLGITVWIYGLVTGKESLAGLGLSLTTVRPQIALFLAIPMLFRHRKVFVGFLIGSVTLAVLSVLLLGFDGTKQFIEIIRVSAGGNWYGIKENAMYNLIGLATRTMPQLDIDLIRMAAWFIYGIAMIGMCILWFKTQDAKPDPIGIAVTLAVLVAPHLHLHDLALLLIPIYELIRKSTTGGNLKTSVAILLPIATSLLFLLSNVSPYLQYTIPYLIMLILAYYLRDSKPKIPFAAPRQS